MTDHIAELQGKLDQVLRFAEDPSVLALTTEEGHDLQERAEALTQRLARSEREPLAIGLLGGTGVGKSTLMNALAGAEISTASHRRPKTDQVIVYRHEDARRLPAEQFDGFPWREITHNNPSIGELLLCDLPDFDSIRPEHRQRVLDFLEHLDLLVWVVSPEKYADQQLYDFLIAVPKSQSNFYFLVNKLDLFFQETPPEKGYEKIMVLSETFQKRLRENGVAEPLIFLVSAKSILKGESSEPWNQFPSFRSHIFQERRIKEISAIKASNLDVEIRSLLDNVRKGIGKLESFEAILAKTVEYLQSRRAAWSDEWSRAIEGWVGRYVRNKIDGRHPDPVPLLGPGYGVAAVLGRIKKGRSDDREAGAEQWTDAFPEAVFATFQIQLDAVATRMDTERLQHGLPEEITMDAGGALRGSGMLEALKRTVSKTLARHMGQITWPPFLGFKIWQGTCYFFLFAIFLVAIGAEAAWKDVLHNPGAATVFQLVLSVVHTLFSGKGLAALGSYVILNAFLGLRFFRRFETLVRKMVDRKVSELTLGLLAAWENQMDVLRTSFDEAQKKIRKEKAKIKEVAGDVH